ncbi:MAG: hypothetical protein Q9162_001283 [Coniocarpon cinnabarinum]
MPKLFAIADIHLGHPLNREEWSKLGYQPEDSLILAGDCGESEDHLRLAFSLAADNFYRVYWVPGNHELYTMPANKAGPRGEAKYQFCVKIAREYGVRTPEDEWELWEGDGGPAVIALCFTLYDYSFRPMDVRREDVIDWAKEENVEATDEHVLHYEPHESRDAWCESLVQKFENKFEEAKQKWPDVPTVIVNHWPLKEELITIPLVPRFTPWCGTTKTEEWHKKWNAVVVATGHLHVRRTDWIEGTRFEECSLGYPRQWRLAREAGKGVDDMLREILPGHVKPEHAEGSRQTIWRTRG